MKHDLEAFSRDIVSLIKTSGDTGGSGDKSKKSLQHSDIFVPTRQTTLSPVVSDWGHEVSASGDRKSKHLQSVVPSVPTVPTATAEFRQGQDDATEGRAPEEWHAILADLESQSCPDWMSPDRWIDVLSDADLFLDRWGAAAYSLGWTALDLFGVHPIAPAARVGAMGLLLLIQGGTVVALTAHTASIRRTTGAGLSFARSIGHGAVLISTVNA